MEEDSLELEVGERELELVIRFDELEAAWLLELEFCTAELELELGAASL